MKYIKFQKVDRKTGIPVSEAAPKHGPVDPIPNIHLKWWDHNTRPSTYYGEVANTAKTDTPGVLAVMTEEEWSQLLDDAKRQTTLRLAAHRFQEETGGLDLPDGTRIKTDRESQSMTNNAYISLQGGLIADTEWKADSGWIEVTLAELEPIATAMSNHVRACFKAEKTVSDLIEACTTLDELRALKISDEFKAAYDAEKAV